MRSGQAARAGRTAQEHCTSFVDSNSSAARRNCVPLDPNSMPCPYKESRPSCCDSASATAPRCAGSKNALNVCATSKFRGATDQSPFFPRCSASGGLGMLRAAVVVRTQQHASPNPRNTEGHHSAEILKSPGEGASPCRAVARSIPSYWWLCQVTGRIVSAAHKGTCSLCISRNATAQKTPYPVWSKASGSPQLLQGPEPDCTQLYKHASGEQYLDLSTGKSCVAGGRRGQWTQEAMSTEHLATSQKRIVEPTVLTWGP